MSINYVFFDLDGTLLPMDQEAFIGAYFKSITQKVCESISVLPDKFMKAMYSGIDAMQKNDGGVSNESAFWKVFLPILELEKEKIEPVLESYYENEFCALSAICGRNERAREVIDLLKAKNIPAVLATNPVFPPVAVYERISWIGLDRGDFAHITTYDNSSSTKPKASYYTEICEKLGIDPAECLMIGNDVRDDMSAERAGMSVFLLTDCLINEENKDISRYKRGGYDELIKYLRDEL